MQSAETRRPPAPEISPLFEARPPLSAQDKLDLHTLFHYGRAHVFERERALPADAAPLRRAIEAGYVIESRHQFHLTPAGVEMIALEDARTREESRREEEAIGAAMRREAARESGHAPTRRRASSAAPAAPAPPRPAAGTPTDLNVWVLSEIFGTAQSVPNRAQRTQLPHLRRCLKAGLLTVSKDRLTLTAAGAAALASYRAAQPKPNAKPGAAISFKRLRGEDKSLADYDIIRDGRVVGAIRADRQETSRSIHGNATYATASWTVEFMGEGGRNLLSEDDAEFYVTGFRSARRWNEYAKASTAAEVAQALREAKDAATAWLVAHPDYR